MEDKVLNSGWQKLSSDEGNDYLYRLVEVKSLPAAIRLITAAAKLAQKAGLDGTTHLSADAHSVTISLNSGGNAALEDGHYALAQQIGALIK
jgi:hypothetical protein